MSEELEIINDLPAVAEKNFKSALQVLQISKEKLEVERDECLKLKITDKESLKNVSERRKREKEKRVTLEKRAKEIRDGYNKASKKVIELEKEFVDIIEAGEDYLSDIETKWKAEEARLKKEAEEKNQLRYNKRFQQLSHLGVLATDDMKFRLDDLVIDIELVKNADDDIYEESIYLPFKAIFDKHEEERIEQEKIEQERAAKWQQQLKEMEEQRAKFEEEKRLYEEQQQKRKDAERQNRLSQLSGMGLLYSGQYESFVFEDINVHNIDIATYDEAAWTKLINELTPAIAERKAAVEKRKQEEVAAQEKYRERVRQIEMLGYSVGQTAITGYNSTTDLANLKVDDVEFDSFIDLLATKKGQWESAERERIKNEIIAEEKRQLELDRIKKEAELAEAQDSVKWSNFREKVQELLSEIPEMKDRRYNKAASISKEKLEEIIAIVPRNLLRNK